MSPRVAAEGGYIIVVYTNDHKPPHVHVLKDNHIPRPVQVLENRGFSQHELTEIVVLVRRHKGHCWKIWHDTHGDE